MGELRLHQFVEVLDRPYTEGGACRLALGVVVGVSADLITVLNEDFENEDYDPKRVRALSILEVMARMANL